MWLEPHHADCLIRSVGPIDRFILTAKLHENGWLHSENASGNISPLHSEKLSAPLFFGADFCQRVLWHKRKQGFVALSRAACSQGKPHKPYKFPIFREILVFSLLSNRHASIMG